MKRKRSGGGGFGLTLKQVGQSATVSANPCPPQRHPALLWHMTLEGDWVIRDAPSHEELIRHAEKFGTHQIAETATELGYDLERLTSLIERLDMIAKSKREHDNEGRTFKRGAKRKQQSAEVRAKRLLNWVDPEVEAAALAAA